MCPYTRTEVPTATCVSVAVLYSTMVLVLPVFFSSVGDLPTVGAARAAQRRDLGGQGPTFGPS